jgi:hypothetical protein
MIPEATAQTLRAQLFDQPMLHVYAILDGARDPAVTPWIERSGLESACLYAGAIPDALAAVAPYLVELVPDERATDLLARSWRRSWGIYAATGADLEAVRRHFRRFLQVEDDRGKVLLFRYYDPRVFRVYLPTCSEQELGTIFGPVFRFAVETESGDALLGYVRDGAKLRTDRFDLVTSSWVPAPLDAE